MTHYHLTIKRPGLPSYVVTSRQQPTGTGYVECACEGGEEQLYHDGIDAGEIDEQCPCADCQSDRNVRFARWRKQQEKAGIHVE